MNRNTSQFTYIKEYQIKVSGGTLIFDAMLLNDYHIHITECVWYYKVFQMTLL